MPASVDKKLVRDLIKEIDQMYRSGQVTEARDILNQIRKKGRPDYLVTILANIDVPQAQQDLKIFRSRPQYREIQPISLGRSVNPVALVALLVVIVAGVGIGAFAALNSGSSSALAAVSQSDAASSTPLTGFYSLNMPEGQSLLVQFPDGWVAKETQSMIRFASDAATLERYEVDPLAGEQAEGVVIAIPRTFLPEGNLETSVTMLSQSMTADASPTATSVNNRPAFLVSGTTKSLMAAGPAIDALEFSLAARYIMVDFGEHVLVVGMAAPEGRADLIDPLIHAIAASIQFDPEGSPLSTPSPA